MAAIFEPDLLRALLIGYARQRRSVSYSELFGDFGLRFSRPKVRTLCKVLAQVDHTCKKQGEPELAVLVVRGSDRLPGNGWWQGRVRYLGDTVGPEADKYVRRVQNRAFEYWKVEQPLDR